MEDPKKFWTKKADDLKKSRQFEEAIKILDKVQEIEQEEQDDNFWYKKAIHCSEIGEYEQARVALEKDLEMNEKSYDTFFLFGQILYELKKYEESLEYYNRASELNNSQHLRNSQKIDRMKNVRKFEEAVKYSDLVHQEKQLDDTYWHHRGMTLFHLKKFKDASSCFKNCLKTDQKNLKILSNLAKSELYLGNKQTTLELLEKICSIDPTIKETLKNDKDFDPILKENIF